MKNIWDERYAGKEYVYGKEANSFLKEQIAVISRGKILLPCEGEGRNAVYAATQNWEVDAFDQSNIGRAKCIELSEEYKVSVNYQVTDALDFDFGINKYDVIGLIYAHFPPEIRAKVHQQCIYALKPGGTIILEAFNPLQLNNTSGGPKDVKMLYTESLLKGDFEGLKIELLQMVKSNLNEGEYHCGKADIIRLKGIKI